MNERIKELMLEAGYASLELALRAQLLASLIINACIKQCNITAEQCLKEHDNQYLTKEGKMLYQGMYGGAKSCVSVIGTHFKSNETSNL